MSMKPKCKMCGGFHFSYEPHVIGEAPDPPSEEEVAEAENKQVIANKKWRQKYPERYREYMRNYMRKRRAEGKA